MPRATTVQKNRARKVRIGDRDGFFALVNEGRAEYGIPAGQVVPFPLLLPPGTLSRPIHVFDAGQHPSHAVVREHLEQVLEICSIKAQKGYDNPIDLESLLVYLRDGVLVEDESAAAAAARKACVLASHSFVSSIYWSLISAPIGSLHAARRAIGGT